MSLFAPSCIVADPPEYTTAVQRAPVLDLYDADPSILRTIEVNTSKTPVVSISVPVRSEDAGEPLLALLFLDYGTTPSSAPVGYLPISASTYDDSNRVASPPWIVSAGISGCHRLTLLVGHQSSFDFETFQVLPSRTSDIAVASWIVIVNVTDGTPVDLTTCPEPPT